MKLQKNMLCATVVSALITTTASSQEAVLPRGASGRMPVDVEKAATALAMESMLTPIRTKMGSNKKATESWTTGRGFKASFHDGFTFYPVLGPDYPRNLPWRWRTLSVRVGDTALALRSAEHGARTDWRYEYDLGTVTEAYDVSGDGIEQTFVFASRPAAMGDLTITGEVSSELECRPVAAAHGGLVFKDAAGNPIVDYGAAVAVDAHGNRFPMRTEHADGRVRLILDAADLALARFPLTVDPIIGRTALRSQSTATFGTVESLRVAQQGDRQTNSYLVTWARQASASDWDVFGVVTDEAFTSSPTIFRDLAAKTRWIRPAYVSESERWVIAYQVESGTPINKSFQIALYVHHASSSSLNSGSTRLIPKTTGFAYRCPEVGGTVESSTGNKALIVYQKDRTTRGSNTSTTAVVGRIFNVNTRRIGAEFTLSTGTGGNIDRERPHVNQVSGGGTNPWIVVWQELDRSSPAGEWNIVGRRVGPGGPLGVESPLCPPQTNIKHRIRPRIAGYESKYVVSYVRSETGGRLGREIAVHRFDWPSNASFPTDIKTTTVATDTTAPFRMTTIDIAFDRNTESHWAMTYQHGSFADAGVSLVRLGHSGGVVERVVVQSILTEVGGGLAFDARRDRFVHVHNTGGGRSSVFAELLVHGGANVTAYGTACRGKIESERPYAGMGDFGVRLSDTGARSTGGQAILAVGVQPVSIPLDLAGMPGCTLLVDPLATVPTLLGPTGSAELVFDLPDNPVFIGDIRLQWFFPGTNPTQMYSTRALHLEVKN